MSRSCVAVLAMILGAEALLVGQTPVPPPDTEDGLAEKKPMGGSGEENKSPGSLPSQLSPLEKTDKQDEKESDDESAKQPADPGKEAESASPGEANKPAGPSKGEDIFRAPVVNQEESSGERTEELRAVGGIVVRGAGGFQPPERSWIAWNGKLRTLYRRQALRYHLEKPSERDADMLADLSLRLSDVFTLPLSLDFFGRYERDQGGTEVDSDLYDIIDKRGGDDIKIYRANAKYIIAADMVTVVAGRQSVDSAEAFAMDGGLLRVDSFIHASMYGGGRVSYYSHNARGAIIGGSLESDIVDEVTLGVRGFHFRDTRTEWDADFRPTDALDGHIVSRARDMKLMEFATFWDYSFKNAGLDIGADYTRRTDEDDYFYDYTAKRTDRRGITRLNLGRTKASNDYTVRIRQELFSGAWTSVDGFRRMLIGNTDNDPFNSNEDEIRVRFDTEDWPWSGAFFFAGVTEYRAKHDPDRSLDWRTVEGYLNVTGEGVSRSRELAASLRQQFDFGLSLEGFAVYSSFDYKNRFGTVRGASSLDFGAEATLGFLGRFTLRLRGEKETAVRAFSPEVDDQTLVEIELGLQF